MENKYKYLGINDDENICCVCGKKSLKVVMWFEDLETGNIFWAGTTCGAKIKGMQVKEYKKYIKEETKIIKEKANKEKYNSVERKEWKEYITYLNENNIQGVERYKKDNGKLNKLFSLKNKKEQEIKIKYRIKYFH